MTALADGVAEPGPPDPAAIPRAFRFERLRPWLCWALALAIWVTALAVMATARWDGEIAGFARFSKAWLSAAHFAGMGEVPRTSYGYDGQFYAAIATDPLFLESWPDGALDDAPYRGGRILIPLAAWLLSLGKTGLSVRVYVVLCWALALMAVFVLDRWQRQEGAAPEWGLTLLFSGGLVASVARALPDAAALGLLVLALRAHARRRNGAALAWNVAAVLCRETSLLASLAMAFVDLRARRFKTGLAHLALPLAAAGLWRLWLRARIGTGSTDVESAQRHLGPPLGWLGAKLGSIPSQRPIGQLADLLAMGAVLLALAAAAALLWRWRRWQPLEATFVAFAALALVLTYPVYSEPFAYSRALVALPILGLPLAAREPGSGFAWLVRGAAILGAFGGVVLLWIDLAPAIRRLFA